MTTEQKLNEEAQLFAGGILSLLNNIATPLLGQVSRNKEEILSSKVDLAIKEDLIMRMTITEIVSYMMELGDDMESLVKHSSSWKEDFVNYKKPCLRLE